MQFKGLEITNNPDVFYYKKYNSALRKERPSSFCKETVEQIGNGRYASIRGSYPSPGNNIIILM